MILTPPFLAWFVLYSSPWFKKGLNATAYYIGCRYERHHGDRSGQRTEQRCSEPSRAHEKATVILEMVPH